ncbi:MAG TPA: bifunctional phosphoribosyl-AMP cyclohydrolase/phosphoribosyl-ATP diphosphatase HisIE [Gemmatimonadales bacterium]
MTAANWLEEVRFGADGLVPVVAQERLSGDVLMLAWANRDALEQTLLSGQAHYYSRSRRTLWRKGETSGHEQRVVEIRLDCDGDAVLYRVEQTGPACHTGTRTCFSKAVRRDSSPADESIRPVEEEDPGGHQLSRLAALIANRARNPQPGSYTASLLEQGRGKISQKVGEEAVEVVVAANSEDEHRLASEAADLLYHLLVLLQSRGVPLGAVLKELQDREK